MSTDFYRGNLINVEDEGRRRNVKTVRQPSRPMTACGTNSFKPIFFGFLLNAFVTVWEFDVNNCDEVVRKLSCFIRRRRGGRGGEWWWDWEGGGLLAT
jgi:hypothetical protein